MEDEGRALVERGGEGKVQKLGCCFDVRLLIATARTQRLERNKKNKMATQPEREERALFAHKIDESAGWTRKDALVMEGESSAAHNVKLSLSARKKKKKNSPTLFLLGVE